jgi:hypothetical protein
MSTSNPAPIVWRRSLLVGSVAATLVAPKLAAQIGMDILATSPASFADFQKVEQERWTRIIEDNGIKAD